MMREIQLRDAKANLSAVVDDAMQGKPPVITSWQATGRGRELRRMGAAIPCSDSRSPLDGGGIGGGRSTRPKQFTSAKIRSLIFQAGHPIHWGDFAGHKSSRPPRKIDAIDIPGRIIGFEKRAGRAGLLRVCSGEDRMGVREWPHISGSTDFAEVGSQPGSTIAAIKASLSRLLSMPHKRAMIDMPIGLKMSGHRTCDLLAREVAGPSVFLGARRNLWEFPDQASANQHYWQLKAQKWACLASCGISETRSRKSTILSRRIVRRPSVRHIRS